MPRTLADPGLDDAEREVLEHVKRYGLSITHVLPEGESPGWSFSLGLYHSYGHPEVVVFGLEREVSHWLLNHIADGIRAGRPYQEELEYDDLLEGVRCTFKPVARVWYEPFLGWANWYHRGHDYPALQCIWPDHDQRYPWDEGYREDWIRAQPLLFHPDARAARAEEILDSMGQPPD